jgi:hypothetical protein
MSASNTETFNNKDLVLYALYKLGGAERLVHTEDIAVEVFRYPEGQQFYQWERYAQYPDKERVARELRRFKNAKGTALVKGHVNVGSKKDRLDGWMLTAAGVDRIRAIEKEIVVALGLSVGTYSKYKQDKFRRRITRTSCYKTYLKDPKLEKAEDHDFTDMLYCLPDAPSERVRKAYDQLLANAKALGVKDLIEFLEAARDRFRGFFPQ